MFTNPFTTKKTLAPRSGRVIPLCDANLEQVAGGIAGKVNTNTYPDVLGSQPGSSGTA